MEFSFKNQPFTSSLARDALVKENKQTVQNQPKPWKLEFNVSNKENDSIANNKKVEKAEKIEKIEESIEKKEMTLAELFKRNKKNFVEKYEQQKETISKPEEEKDSRGKRTKEEILRQRKEMMEYRKPITKKKQDSYDGEGSLQETEEGRRTEKTSSIDGKSSKGSKDPNADLLERLAHGKKQK